MKYIWLNPVQQPSHAVSLLRCVFQVRFLFGENDFVCVDVRPQCTFASRRSRRTRRCTRATLPSCTARPPATPSPTSTGRSRTSHWTSARTGGEETSLSLTWLCRRRIVIQDFSLLLQIAFCCCFFAWSVSELLYMQLALCLIFLIDVLHQLIEVVTVWSALNLSMVIKSC